MDELGSGSFGETPPPALYYFDVLPVHGTEGRRDRLHCERKAVENGSYNETFECKRQAAPHETLIEPAKWTFRPHGNEDIESQDRGRQHERQRNHGFDKELPSPFGKSHPIAQRQRDDDQPVAAPAPVGSAEGFGSPTSRGSPK